MQPLRDAREIKKIKEMREKLMVHYMFFKNEQLTITR